MSCSLEKNLNNSFLTQMARLNAIAIPILGLLLCGTIRAESSADTSDNVRVRFEVTIPEQDDSEEPMGEVFLSGNIRQLGEWRPNGLKLNRTDENV